MLRPANHSPDAARTIGPIGVLRSRQQWSNSMNPNKELWEKGDFTRIAATMRESGKALAGTLGITRGLRYWTWDAATARRPSRRPNSCRRPWRGHCAQPGRGRQPAGPGRGLSNLRFQEGDATDLIELPDRTFDLVISFFGAMFAPRPFDVAREMVRVTRPGGRIVMGQLDPQRSTLVAQILKISAAYTPPPPEGFISPMTWGIESNVVERFASAGVKPDNVAFTQDTYVFNFPGRPSEFVDRFQTPTAPP